MMYQKIRQQAIDMEPGSWPKSDSFWYYLDRNPDTGMYVVPTFDDGNGPVGIFSLIGDDDDDDDDDNNNHNRAALPIVQECVMCWNQFCNDILQQCIDDDNDDNDNNKQARRRLIESQCLMPSKVHHMTITVFQEHPRLLRTQEEKDRWIPIDQSTIEQLVETITRRFQEDESLKQAPKLLLDALLLTPDGAMIAGFVDETCICFQNLRACCSEVATSVLPSLTSRPKNLIHITIGRVLGLPPDSSVEQRKTLTDFMREYNTIVLPNKVRELQERGMASFDLTSITLLRNTVWLLEESVIYKTWHLQSSTS